MGVLLYYNTRRPAKQAEWTAYASLTVKPANSVGPVNALTGNHNIFAGGNDTYFGRQAGKRRRPTVAGSENICREDSVKLTSKLTPACETSSALSREGDGGISIV